MLPREQLTNRGVEILQRGAQFPREWRRWIELTQPLLERRYPRVQVPRDVGGFDAFPVGIFDSKLGFFDETNQCRGSGTRIAARALGARDLADGAKPDYVVNDTAAYLSTIASTNCSSVT